MDGEIPETLRLQVEMHLAGCRPCTEKLDSLKSTADHLGQIPRAAAPPDFLHRLQERLEKESLSQKLKKLFLLPLRVRLPLELATAAALGILIFFIVQPMRQQDSFKYPVEQKQALGKKQEILPGKNQPARPPGKILEEKPAVQSKAKALKDEAGPSPSMYYEKKQEIRETKGQAAPYGEQMLAKSTVAETESRNVKENASPPPISISLIIPKESKIPATRLRTSEVPVDRMEESSNETAERKPIALSGAASPERGQSEQDLAPASAPDVLPPGQNIEQKIVQLIDAMGGKVVAMERNDAGQPLSANIEIPASKYCQFIDQILQIGKIEPPPPGIPPSGDPHIQMTIRFVAQP
jgi:hypothetical protein